MRHVILELFVKNVAKLVKHRNGRDLDLLFVEAEFVEDLDVFVLLVPHVMDESPEQRLHQMNDTDRTDLVCRQVQHVHIGTNILTFLLAHLTQSDALLLSNHSLQGVHPVDHNPVRGSKLISLSKLHQTLNRVLVLVM